MVKLKNAVISAIMIPGLVECVLKIELIWLLGRTSLLPISNFVMVAHPNTGDSTLSASAELRDD